MKTFQERLSAVIVATPKERMTMQHAVNITSLVNEHQALLAIKEASERLPQWIRKGIADGAFGGCAAPSGANADLKRFCAAVEAHNALQSSTNGSGATKGN